ncbi:MAG TPA: transposase, partial [Acidobacteriaceae bacterium]|nr:transposase [Acidobacteriaceae bacterium]
MVEVGGSVLPSLADAARAGADWRRELRQWLRPYLAALPRRTQRHWAPLYIEGLLGPSPRKSMEPVAALVAGGAYDQLHHFLTTTAWDPAPLKAVLLR